jgi:hypothetical protein
MKIVYFLSAFLIVGSCAKTKYSTKIQNIKNNIHITDSTVVDTYLQTITLTELKTHLYEYSSDNYLGRATGELGQKRAVEFLKSYYQNENIVAPIQDSSYFQVIPESYLPENVKASENVLAYIKGTEKPEEVLVISAHLDHEGIKDGQIYNGADDDGSGTVALMEMAQAFKKAKDDGNGPKRSVLFLHLTAEEIGLQGSQYYTENPIFPLENTIANLNIDMIGRVDKAHENNENYIYLIGSDRLSKELHYISEKVNHTYFNINLDYKYNDENDRNRFYFRSDHYNFAKNNIPVIFYFNGVHEDYHKPSDTPDKINYELLQKRTKLIFATAWQLVNQEQRVALDAVE